MSESSRVIRRPQPLLSTSEINWTTIANATLSQSNSTSTTSSSISDTYSSAIQAVLAAVLLLICLLLSKPRIPDEEHRRGAMLREQARLRWELRQRRGHTTDPVLRKECIEKSLIVKRVVAADNEGVLTLGEPLNAEHVIDEEDAEEDGDHSSGYHSLTDDETHTCVICLEPFRVGDVVAWSRKSVVAEEPECLHVFHQKCIVPWLENVEHNDCPYCRAIILQEDDVDDDHEEKTMSETGPSSTAFVIMHGLISRVRRASYSLIGQSIEFDHEHADHDPLPSLSEPSSLRRVYSLGDRKQSKRLRSSMRRRSVGWRSTSYGSADGHPEDLSMPIGLRRVVSAGPGPPLRNTSGRMHHHEELLEADSVPSSDIDGTILPQPPPMRRIKSSAVPRPSRAQDSSERSEEDEIRVITAASVSWRDLGQSEIECTEEEEIINDIA